MASWRKQLLGRPVLIASHAGPAHRGRAGVVVNLKCTTATIDLSTPRYVERVNVDLRGLRLIRRANLNCASRADNDGSGYCRGCGVTIGEPHHPGCDRAAGAAA